MRIKYSKVTSAPATEPIALQDAKIHLKVDGSEEDDLITIFIQSAREMVEQFTNRSLITQTRTLKLDYFPCNESITLTNGPVSAITSIHYYDEDETSTPLPSDDYWTDLSSDIPRITIKESWPSTKDMPNAVTIVYVCGYGSASNVPAPLRSALLLILGHLYENRQQVISGQAMEIPFGAQALMSSYVIDQYVGQ